MKSQDIENWALKVIGRVKAGQPHEDSRVELKAEWPSEFNKTARQIGGHANAAGGEPILWLIGVDQKTGVHAVPHNELSSWFAKIKAEFDDAVPSMQDLNLSVDGNTVVALVFETDRAPFVVRNEKFGAAGGGPVQWEVPWREATSIRTTTRYDLLRLISTLQSAAELRRKFSEFCTRMGLEWGRQEKIDPFDRTSAKALMERACSGLLDLVALMPGGVKEEVIKSINDAVGKFQELEVELVRHEKLMGVLPDRFWDRGKQLLDLVRGAALQIS